MKTRVLALLIGTFLLAAPVLAQQKTVTGKVTTEQGTPLPYASVIIKGTPLGTATNTNGDYTIRVSVGQTLLFRLIGNAPEERVVGAEDVINVTLKRVPAALDAVVVTALGQTAVQRSLGTSQQSVQGADIASAQRENFINALQGRVAGVEVTSSSGVPGSSVSITIRGVSSISSNNQPLMIIDGLPMDNKTMNTSVLASDLISTQAFSNRGVDFTNRGSDINPEDIESLVVLKGPEASALYGIDAANGAIVITTKRGKAGGGMDYSNSFRYETLRERPSIQRVYGPTSQTGSILGSFSYFGNPYSDTTRFFDNIDGFFRPALTQKHNLAFSGATQDGSLNYRVAFSGDKQEGVVPNSEYGRINLTGASQAQVNSWLKADLSMQYSYSNSDQPYKGANGPLIGLLVWPQTDSAKAWLTPGGLRRRVTAAASADGETDNPYFNVEKNQINAKNNRLIANLGLTLTPLSWGSLKTNIGMDGYTNANQILRHPESIYGFPFNGMLEVATDVTRNLNAQTLLSIYPRKIWGDVSVSGLVGNQVSDFNSRTDALKGQDFLDPNFVSINNTVTRTNRTTISRRRLVAVYGQAQFDYKKYLYVTVTGRNDWTSTIPVERNSFFYPSVATSFIFSDAFPSLGDWMTGKLRASYAEVGKDARPYAYIPSLENKTTSNGGYGYGFTGPNRGLKPEFAISREIGTELGFLDDRLGLDVTYYHKQTRDQIVNDLRGSYGTGFILYNMNGASTENKGLEISLKGTPVLRRDFSWDVQANFERARGKVLSLPNKLPESYVSDTWLYGNVRNGVMPGLSTRSLTGFYYLRDTVRHQILIDPTTGLPLRSSVFIDAGYDRQPDYTIGVTNTVQYKRFTLNFLIDIRKGGDVLNATEHYLTARGLSMRTLDRDKPIVIPGILRDGKENTDNPTYNNIVIVPAVQTGYYTNMSEELFIEKDINWVRLKDVTLRYSLPGQWLNARDASVFVTGTDLFIFTNYTGMDPIVNGNTAAVGGSGGAGLDFGNFPVPRGISLGLKARF